MQYKSNFNTDYGQETERVLAILGNEIDGFNELWFNMQSNTQDKVFTMIQDEIEAIQDKNK